ncbi:MAG: nucleoside deaminase [Alphaproteobacteria bacterium]
MTDKQKYMNIAIEEANKCLETQGFGPFGACIVKDGKIIAKGNNQVVSSCDPTNHAEINAIRKACELLQTHDLSGCQLFSSSEPCPMCMSACYWAKISEIYYANTVADAASIGFIDDDLYNFFKSGNFEHIKIEHLENETAIDTFKNYKGLIY